ncbi:SOS response-associated peptidase family protein [Jiella sp. MQZ9-1]|uniref:Abasic site processing protein n=1 Tax=Jiella flava TaxID=2816857 RepID=A0A939FU29_9HYPH|nr:SOS response-associated peptidase family protein [Jiella flava]MBO0661440.1 SOS response-associated peptidase family protein [Jiella flava]MCD2470083.1 SOS response-associated peptidase family protein [Jiella flava]
MCNLYSVTTGQQAIRDFTDAARDTTGNLPPLPGIFPDTEAPVVRTVEGARELTMMRWGMPSPAFVTAARKADSGVTNIRNIQSAHWRPFLSTAHRCVVPFTSFCEYADRGDQKHPVWFALSENRPLAVFAGLWTQWTGVRKVKEGPVTVNLFGFLTCAPNAEVGRVHPKAMPVILTEPAEIDRWLDGPWEDAARLQRPLPDGTLTIVAEGARQASGELAQGPAQLTLF